MNFSIKNIEAILDDLFNVHAEEAKDNMGEIRTRAILKRSYDKLREVGHIDRVLSQYEIMLEELYDSTDDYYELSLDMATLSLIMTIIDAEFFRGYIKERWPNLYVEEGIDVATQVATQQDFFNELAKLKERGNNDDKLHAALSAYGLSQANSLGGQLASLNKILEYRGKKDDSNNPGLIIPQSN
jgi:hypothetical protein